MQDDSYLGDSRPRARHGAAQITDFVRFDALDAYELTDDELARLLELWRWTAWTEYGQPNPIDNAIQRLVREQQRELANALGIDLEYNTAILLKQEIEAQMHFHALTAAPRALAYFIRRARVIAFFVAWRRHRRYARINAGHAEQRRDRGYPADQLAAFGGRAPDLLRRRYWRALTPHSFEERRHLGRWW